MIKILALILMLNLVIILTFLFGDLKLFNKHHLFFMLINLLIVGLVDILFFKRYLLV